MKKLISSLVAAATFSSSALHAQEAKKIDFPQPSPLASVTESD